MTVNDKVLINRTGQTAVVVCTSIQFREWKLIKCYEVMYQLPDKKMYTVGKLHPDNLTLLKGD